MPRLILASTSRYRRELLARLGLPFEVRSPGTDETPLSGEPPAALAARLALAKARAIQAADAVVIGADQAASLDDRRLGKPGGHPEALRQLQAAQGKKVLFHTAVAVVDAGTGREWTHVDQTGVQFARLTDAELDRYLKLEQPYDCAGSFKSEGLGVVLFERIESSDPTALIGLPLIWLAAALRSAGLDPLAAPLAGHLARGS
jgi:7-methyl-GTP pyrophosphatase